MPKRKQPAKLPKARRARGTGSIFPDKRRGGYVAKVPVGRYENGRTRYKEVRGATQAEVVEKMKGVAPPDPTAVTVAEWARRWRAGLDVRPATATSYDWALGLIVGSLGHVRLRELTVSQVKAALASWVTPERGAAAANVARGVGRNMMRAAVAEDLLARDPFGACPPLKREAEELDPFTGAELRALAGWWREHRLGPWLALVATTGLRAGEASALDVADIDTERWTAAVTKTFCAEHGVGPPKSKHSRRTVDIPPAARPAVLHAIGGRTAGVLFARRDGGSTAATQVRAALRAACKALDIRYRKLHALRHGVLTDLVNRGAPLGDVARHAGHSVATLVKVYVKKGRGQVGAHLGEMFPA